MQVKYCENKLNEQTHCHIKISELVEPTELLSYYPCITNNGALHC